MTFSFDYGGVLREHPEFQELFGIMRAYGHDMHVISAIPEKHVPNKILYEICNRFNLPKAQVHMVVWKGEATPESIYEAGLEKAKVMEDIGAKWHIDDNQHIINAIISTGQVGILAKIPLLGRGHWDGESPHHNDPTVRDTRSLEL